MQPRKKPWMALILLLILLVIGAAGFIVAARLDQQQSEGIITGQEGSYGELPRITWQGATYRQKSGIHTILVVGYDKSSTDERVGFRDGGQCDFLMLLVVDDKSRTVRQLHIDRDTMTNITILGLSGKPAGHKVQQICLAHAFGDNVAYNDQLTREAVEGFLPGVKVESSISMGFDFIERFNHLVGGVTVTIDDDLSALDPAMVPGATLKLTDRQAFDFCHARMTVGDGLNTSRMRRQRVYIDAAAKLMLNRIKRDGEFASMMVDSVYDITHCTLSKGRLINEINRAASYTLMSQEVLPSEHWIGEDGYLECHVKEEDVMAWVLDVFYIKE